MCVYCRSYKLNIWDVGGQKSLRSYWRNYFERTDGLVWVVDSADRQRMEDCRQELHKLLLEEVPPILCSKINCFVYIFLFCLLEVTRCNIVGVCKQARFTWCYVGRRDTSGKAAPSQYGCVRVSSGLLIQIILT